MDLELMNSILSDPSAKADGLKLYNYVERSASSEFYASQFSGNEVIEKAPAPDYTLVPAEMNETMAFFKQRLNEDAIVVELGGSRYQHRSGYPCFTYKNYIPTDISYTSIRNYVQSYDRFGVVADACKLPFKDNSIDAIFTHAFLEHPLEPEKVLSEICRVLKPGGYIVHSDAWNCRWWQRYGVVGRKKFADMTGHEKLIFIGSRITEFKGFRFPALIGQRLFTQLSTSTTKAVNLKYKKLNPNYSLHLYIDEDAASSIDPTNVILFYESRGFKTITPLSMANRLLFKSMNIYLQKGK